MMDVRDYCLRSTVFASNCVTGNTSEQEFDNIMIAVNFTESVETEKNIPEIDKDFSFFNYDLVKHMLYVQAGGRV